MRPSVANLYFVFVGAKMLIDSSNFALLAERRLFARFASSNSRSQKSFQLLSTEHIWIACGSASSSNDTECYIGEKDCEKLGEKRRCAACHIVAHSACLPVLAKMNLNCKATFRDCAQRQNAAREAWSVLNKHHWVHRRKLDDQRCQHCAKSFQQRMFRDKVSRRASRRKLRIDRFFQLLAIICVVFEYLECKQINL